MSNHGTLAIVLGALAFGVLRLLHRATLQDLNQTLILIGASELVLERRFAGLVQHALGAMFVGDEDLEAGHDLSERDGSIALPLLDLLGVVDEDDEVFFLALVEDFGLGGVSSRHGV